MSITLIDCDNIALFRGHRLLFKQLSFCLDRGQAIHLVGSNGAGKTSLFKVITGQLQVQQGGIKLFDKTHAELSANDYYRLIYLGHKAAVKEELTVKENILFNAEIFDGDKVTSTQLAETLDMIGLSQFIDQPVGKLSAGQKRRVLLARLWLNDNKTLWLLDEPLTALDTATVAKVEARIDDLLTKGAGVIYTSHQPLSLQQPSTSLQL